MEEQDQAGPASSKRKEGWFEIDDDHKTYVYVNGLPTDMSEEDFIVLMKKYGVIKNKAPPNNSFNIKMYKNPDGSFKGDAVCCYARVESVELALTHLDGYQYDEKHIIHCERAKFQMKGSYDESRKKPRVVDKKSKIKQKKKIDKLLSWEEKTMPEVKLTKVILKHMFSPDEILEDATLILDIKEDVESKCAEFSCEPKRVDIYDKHPDGVVAVTFAESSQAEKCVSALNNMYYAERVVEAELWDGKTKYKIKETDEEAEKRLQKWHQDIQKSGDDSDGERAPEGELESQDQGTTEPKVHSTEAGLSKSQ